MANGEAESRSLFSSTGGTSGDTTNGEESVGDSLSGKGSRVDASSQYALTLSVRGVHTTTREANDIEEEPEECLCRKFEYKVKTRSVVDDFFHRQEIETLRREIQEAEVREFQAVCEMEADHLRCTISDLLDQVKNSCESRGHFSFVCLNVLKAKPVFQ